MDENVKIKETTYFNSGRRFESLWLSKVSNGYTVSVSYSTESKEGGREVSLARDEKYIFKNEKEAVELISNLLDFWASMPK